MKNYGELCYNHLLKSAPEKINCLQIQNFIILEKQIFQSSHSGARIAPGSFEFPILSVSYLDHKRINFTHLQHNQILTTSNEEIRRCDIMNPKSLKILKGFGYNTCLVVSKNIPCGPGCVRLEGCYGDLGWDIRAKCLKRGKPCPDFSSLFDGQQDIKQCLSASSKTENALLISSGVAKATNELFHPEIDLGSCSIPDLPQSRSRHTLTGFKVCGGKSGDIELDNCTILHQGKWEVSNILTRPRADHSAFETNEGLLLFGGSQSAVKGTTEMVKFTGKTELSFTLEDDYW